MRLLYAADHRIDAYLVHALREAGHVVEASDQPADALAMAGGGDYRAIVLDWAETPVPCVGDFARAAARTLLVVITADSDAAGRTGVLAAGADACFERPLSYIELEARLEALRRLVDRARPAAQITEAGAGAEMLPTRQAVRVGDLAIALSPREYRVMAHLVAHAGEVVGLDGLWLHGWGDAEEPRPDLAQACLSRLRRKLRAAGAAGELRMAGGHGYVFQPSGPARALG
jgi:two-component system OmpR family response regulator